MAFDDKSMSNRLGELQVEVSEVLACQECHRYTCAISTESLVRKIITKFMVIQFNRQSHTFLCNFGDEL